MLNHQFQRLINIIIKYIFVLIGCFIVIYIRLIWYKKMIRFNIYLKVMTVIYIFDSDLFLYTRNL